MNDGVSASCENSSKLSITLKSAVESTSYMKCFVYVEKVKMFGMTNLVGGLQHMML
jgi:hypothetical protein